jgi:hypothetical protein
LSENGEQNPFFHKAFKGGKKSHKKATKCHIPSETSNTCCLLGTYNFFFFSKVASISGGIGEAMWKVC